MKKYIIIIVGLLLSSCASMANQTVSDNTTKEPPRLIEFVRAYPTFPGGDMALKNFIEANMQYPKLDTITGNRRTVVVRFTVTPTGKLADVKVSRSLSPEFDEEALRIVKSMPNWLPGKQNGQPVSVQFNLPIRFIKQE